MRMIYKLSMMIWYEARGQFSHLPHRRPHKCCSGCTDLHKPGSNSNLNPIQTFLKRFILPPLPHSRSNISPSIPPQSRAKSHLLCRRPTESWVQVWRCRRRPSVDLTWTVDSVTVSLCLHKYRRYLPPLLASILHIYKKTRCCGRRPRVDLT